MFNKWFVIHFRKHIRFIFIYTTCEDGISVLVQSSTPFLQTQSEKMCSYAQNCLRIVVLKNIYENISLVVPLLKRCNQFLICLANFSLDFTCHNYDCKPFSIALYYSQMYSEEYFCVSLYEIVFL